jgi:hypothetical protein
MSDLTCSEDALDAIDRYWPRRFRELLMTLTVGPDISPRDLIGITQLRWCYAYDSSILLVKVRNDPVAGAPDRR